MQPQRTKYVVMNVMVWPENERYVKRAAEAQSLPINEIMRRILAEAEVRGLFLPADCFQESIPPIQEEAQP